MKVLVIDDEPQIRRALRAGLEHNGYEVMLAGNGEEGLDTAALKIPDILILDLALPGTDGFTVLKQLREWSKIPVIVLTVREGEEEKIKALDLGADDYLIKPFGLGELLARMRAVLRRANSEEREAESTFSYQGLFVDMAKRLVSIDEIEVHLTPKEYDLLKYMILQPNRVLTHRQLLTKVWGPEYSEDHHTLRVHIANLRNKIESHPERPRLIHTEMRIGYRFRVDQ
ncbi:MAG TPA: response regulator transcription factor [Candidatus Melainabacteria bacterium]|jgi:two-component system, OmpR family, KDP operon response regulator KdpE|nr:response regulator transcription factor [Candidatus Melainabacteria bacterium]HIN66708.1 response regulator transcription factor [Candidatus Obscuribacterales bacterium]